MTQQVQEALEIPFVEYITPLGQKASEVLKTKAEKFRDFLADSLFDDFEKSLMNSLGALCAPSLILEMHIAKLHESLKGETSKDRYRDFVARTLDPEWEKEFYGEYTLLKDAVAITIQHWEESALEYFERLKADHATLEQQTGKQLGKAVHVGLDLSDPHCRGRSVYKTVFEEGTIVYYKPKEMKIAKLFNDLIDELNAIGLNPQLKSYFVIDRGNYGWVENIEARKCKNEEEVKTYYGRSGMLLCLVELLRGTDFHFENIIASGEHPILVDLETLFCPDRKDKYSEYVTQETKMSVLSTGLLPSFLVREVYEKVFSIGGLPVREVEKPEGETMVWKHRNTDEMCIAFEKHPMGERLNIVKVEETYFYATDYIEDVVKGYEEMYRFIQKHKEKFLGEKGYLSAFGGAAVRYVLRPTYVYAKLLRKMTDPALLCNEEAMHNEIDAIGTVLMEDGQEYYKPVFDTEKASLLGRDIPYFITYPNSVGLYSDGKLVLDDCIEEPPLEAVYRKFEEMSEAKMRLQSRFILESLSASRLHDKAEDEKQEEAIASKDLQSEEAYLELAEKTAEEILSKAFPGENGCLSWVGLELNPITDQWVFQPVSQNLYSGRPGIALFFAALSAISGKEKWKKTTLDTLQLVVAEIDGEGAHRLPGAYGIGGMSGVGGVIYALHACAKLTGDSSLTEKAIKLAHLVEERHIESDGLYDLIGGSAGIILALLSLYKDTKDSHLLKICNLAGEHLQKNALRDKDGIGWPTADKKRLTGFSHGTAGIAYALFHLADVTQNATYRETAKEAIAWERAMFSDEKQLWPDFRHEEVLYPAQWCHGATGIGIGRLAGIPVFQDEKVKREIELALQATLDTGFTAIDHMCCGNMSRLDFMNSLSKKYPEMLSTEKVRSLYSQFLSEALHRKNFRCLNNLPPQIISTGFMQGNSGVGYALLRYIDHEGILPNPLVLE